MEAVKKYWFWGILISILSIFAMSHNANAIDVNINLNNYDLIRHTDSVQIKCRINGSNLSNEAYSCGVNNNLLTNNYLEEIRFYSDYHWSNNGGVKKGDLLEWYLVAYTENVTSLESTLRGPLFLTTYEYLDTLSIKEITSVEGYKLFSLDCPYIQSEGAYFCQAEDGYRYYKVYDVVQRVNSDLTQRWTYGLNVSSPYHIFEWNQLYATIGFKFRIMNFNQYRFIGSEENKEVEEKTQEAVDESEAAGGSSSQDAQTGTTGLLNAITGAVSVISSAQPTNCKINGNMGNLDIGQLDLCANPAPAFVQTIGSLILILMCVPLAISLFNRFIAIFRSFQS